MEWIISCVCLHIRFFSLSLSPFCSCAFQETCLILRHHKLSWRSWTFCVHACIWMHTWCMTVCLCICTNKCLSVVFECPCAFAYIYTTSVLRVSIAVIINKHVYWHEYTIWLCVSSYVFLCVAFRDVEYYASVCLICMNVHMYMCEYICGCTSTFSKGNFGFGVAKWNTDILVFCWGR